MTSPPETRPPWRRFSWTPRLISPDSAEAPDASGPTRLTRGEPEVEVKGGGEEGRNGARVKE